MQGPPDDDQDDTDWESASVVSSTTAASGNSNETGSQFAANIRRAATHANSMSLSISSEDEDFASPGKVQRRCTDLKWFLTFVAATLVLWTLGAAGLMSGNYAKFFAVHDWMNHTCGRGNLTSREFLYFCSIEGKLDFQAGVCREDCPTSHETQTLCFNTKSYAWENHNDYPTEKILPAVARFCWPADEKLHLQALRHARKIQRVVADASELVDTLAPLLVGAGMGIFVSFGFVTILKDHAQMLASIGIKILVAVPWVWAVVLKMQHRTEADVACIALAAVGVFFACMACSNSEHISRATACIQLSCECVVDMPVLRIGPTVQLLLRTVSAAFMVALLSYIMPDIYYDVLEDKFHFECGSSCAPEVALLVFWCVMGLWMENFLTACWEFAIVYLTSIWYFEGGIRGQPPPGFRQGFQMLRVMCRYHLGTMALAGLVLYLLRPLRFVIGTLTAAARMERNAVGQCLRTCFGCCVFYYEEYLEHLSANLFNEVALVGTAFVASSHKASDVNSKQQDTASNLNGATFIFQLVCLTTVWWIGYFSVWVMATGHCPGCERYADVNSIHYIDRVGLWSNTAGIIAVVCAFPTMMVFDVASDTILYCATLDQIRSKKNYDEMSHAERVQAGTSDVLQYLQDVMRLGCGGTRA